MIYLTKGQKLFENPGMVVYDQTGYYNDGDSVICAGATSPDEPACRYEAKFVAYGGMVYSVADPDALMEQILALDPKSLFGKDSQQVAVDKVVEEIVPQVSEDLSGEVVAPAEEEVVEEETATTTDPVILPEEETSTSTTTPQTNTGTSTTTPSSSLPDINTASTTPGIVFPDDTTSTTTQSLGPVGGSGATTTPPAILLPDIDTSTTTPAVVAPDSGVSDPIIEPSPSGSDIIPSIPVDTETSTTSQVVAFAKKLVKNVKVENTQKKFV